MTRRIGWIAAVGALALCPPVAAQDEAAAGLAAPHQQPVPNYLRDMLLADVASIRVPLPPIEVPELPTLVRTEPSPNYLAWVGVPQPAPITLPAPPPGRPPAVVRGIYLNAWVFGSGRFYDLVALADSTEVNAFVMDVKDATGFIAYRSGVPTAGWHATRCWHAASRIGRYITRTVGCGATASASPGWTRSTTRFGSTRPSSQPKRS